MASSGDSDETMHRTCQHRPGVASGLHGRRHGENLSMSETHAGNDGLHLLMLEHHQLEQMYAAWRNSSALPPELRFRQACAFCCRMVVHSIVETQLFYRMLRVAGAAPESEDEAAIEQL
jgi:hypothetical protein